MNIGEWWYTDSNDLLFAGDDAELNHEGHVMEQAQSQIADILDFDYSGLDVPVFEEAVREIVNPNDSESLREALARYVRQEDLDHEVLDLWNPATDRDADLREFAVRQWDWIWICIDQIGMARYNDAHLRRLRRAIDDIAEDMGLEDDELLKLDLRVRVYASDGRGLRDYSLDWEQLQEAAAVPGHDILQPAGISRHDEAMPAYYRQHRGD